MRQMQRTFCFLRDSELQSFDPALLVESCRDLGLHFRVQAQNDTTEFLEKLLERLEKEMGGKSNIERLDQFFRVRISSQLVSTECPHRKSIHVGVFEKSLKVNVQRLTTLENALSQLLSGELMTGDARVLCEECTAAAGQKTYRAMRRTNFIDGNSLPSIINIQLNRFKFQDGGKKLNDRLAFPLVLDMAPYCMKVTATDGLDRETSLSETTVRITDKLLYELSGVVVHSGEFGYGHYYSFIRDNAVPSRWWRLDDHKVTIFDINDLEKECFGGIQTVVNEYCWVSKQERKASAYMLFYRRVGSENQPSTPPPPYESEAMDEGRTPPSALDSDLSSLKRALSGSPIAGAAFPEDLRELEEEISDTNEQVLRRALMFDDAFSGFILDFVTNATPPPDQQMELTAMATTVFFKSVLHSKSRARLREWSSELQSLFLASAEASEWFIDRAMQNPTVSDRELDGSSWIESALIKCPMSEVRDVVKDLISAAAGCVVTRRGEALEAVVARMEARQQAAPPGSAESSGPSPMVTDDTTDTTADASVSRAASLVEAAEDDPDAGDIGRLITYLIKLVPTAAQSWKNLSHYSALWLSLSRLSPIVARYLVARDVLGHLIHLYLGHRSPADRERVRLPVLPMMGGTMLVPDTDELLNTVAFLVSLRLPLPALSQRMLETHVETPAMSTLATKLVEYDAGGGAGVVGECLLAVLCRDQPLEVSNSIIAALIQGLEKNVMGVGDGGKRKQQAARVEALMQVLAMDDTHTEARVDAAMNELVEQARAKSKTAPHHFKRIAQAIVRLQELTMCRKWLLDNKDKWTWMANSYGEHTASLIMRTESARSAFDALRQLQLHAETVHIRVSAAGSGLVNGVYAYAGTIPGHGPHFTRLCGDVWFRVWRRRMPSGLSSWHITQGATEDLLESGIHFYCTKPTAQTGAHAVPQSSAIWEACPGRRGEAPMPVVKQELTRSADTTDGRGARGACTSCVACDIPVSQQCIKFEEPVDTTGRCGHCYHREQDHELLTNSPVQGPLDSNLTPVLVDMEANSTKRKGVVFPQPSRAKRAQPLSTQVEGDDSTVDESSTGPLDRTISADDLDSAYNFIPWKCPRCHNENAQPVEAAQYQLLTAGQSTDFECGHCKAVSAVSIPSTTPHPEDADANNKPSGSSSSGPPSPHSPQNSSYSGEEVGW